MTLKNLLRGSFAVAIAFSLCSCTTTNKQRAGIELFNGKNLNGWKHVLEDPQVPREKVWSVEDGILVCQGTPFGALYTGNPLTNFRMVVEYRWAPGQKPGNSGIFSRMQVPPTFLPKTIETQLMHGNAGDVIGLQGMKIKGGQPRFFEVKAHPKAGDISGVKKMFDAEKQPGEWNRVEILAQGPTYTVWMNGKLINQVEGVDTTPGPVGVQSEGGVIHFRRIALTPMD